MSPETPLASRLQVEQLGSGRIRAFERLALDLGVGVSNCCGAGRVGLNSARAGSSTRLTLRLRHQSQVGTGGFWLLLLPVLTLVWGPICPIGLILCFDLYFPTESDTDVFRSVGVVSNTGAANGSDNPPGAGAGAVVYRRSYWTTV